MAEARSAFVAPARSVTRSFSAFCSCAVALITDCSIEVERVGEESRILTMSATIDRPFWDFEQPELRTPRFTRATAEVFIHTEWAADPVPPAA